ncbi:MAG: BTAD domain-containing putative transcriptional regulator [Microthrixaceae bacterium]
MGSLRAEIFGGLRLSREGVALQMRGSKRCLIVATLVANANTPVSVGSLIEVLDPIGSERDPQNALQAQIARLRKVVEPLTSASGSQWLTTEHNSYRLRIDEMDLWEFRHLVRSARSLGADQPLEAFATYRRALSRWSDPFGMIGTSAEFTGLIQSLELEHLTVEDEMLSSLLDCALRGEAYSGGASTRESCAATVDQARQMALSEPLRETRSATVMHILFLAGRHAEALSVFGQTRHALREGLGVGPGPQLSRMWERVLNHDVSLCHDVSRSPGVTNEPVRSLDPGPLCAAITALARYPGQLSILGAEQSGKSRLVRRWSETQDVYERVVWVDLASDSLTGLEDGAVSGSTAVVLDGAHWANVRVPEMVIDLRAHYPELFVIVTGRDPIGLEDEQIVRIPSLVSGHRR